MREREGEGERGRKRGREGGREGVWESEGRRERGREGVWESEGRRERGREGGREKGREGGRESILSWSTVYQTLNIRKKIAGQILKNHKLNLICKKYSLADSTNLL